MVKKVISLLVLTIIVVAISLGIYWKNMSKAERWLFFYEQEALQHSKSLLSGESISKTPDNLIDMHISTYSGAVIFDSNDQNNFFAIAYSPNNAPAPLLSYGGVTTWKKLKRAWYVLDIK